MSGDRWLLAKPDQQLSRFHLRNVRKWDRTKLPGLIAINKKANDESYCISMKWTTILGISYQAVERGKKLSRHWSADLPGLRKFTQCKNKVRHYGSPRGDFAWKCIAYLIQHGAHRTTVSPFPVFVDWTQGRYCKQRRIVTVDIYKVWAQCIPPVNTNKNCIVYLVRFWIIFDNL